MKGRGRADLEVLPRRAGRFVPIRDTSDGGESGGQAVQHGGFGLFGVGIGDGLLAVVHQRH